MAISVALTHRTSYKYDRSIQLSPHIVRLRPAPHARTHIESYSLNISPKDHFINWQQDPFSNWMARLVFPEKVDHFEITVGVSLYHASQDVRWLYVGCRCPSCGVTGVYGDWKNEYLDYRELLAKV